MHRVLYCTDISYDDNSLTNYFIIFRLQAALALQPMTHSTYSAIGYAHALLGDLVEAVEAFHRALSLKRDDTFSKSMLNYVIEQLMGDTAPFDGKKNPLVRDLSSGGSWREGCKEPVAPPLYFG